MKKLPAKNQALQVLRLLQVSDLNDSTVIVG
jgi:hypothetical protein